MLLLTSMAAQAQSLQTPAVDSISIDNTNPIISWFANNDSTEVYEIHKCVYEEINNEIHTVCNFIDSTSGTTYIHEVNACDIPLRYCIVAHASGGRFSAWSDTLYTIFLKQPSFDICANEVQLRWTPYRNMVSSLGGYRILASKNDEIFMPIDSTAADVTQFTHSNLDAGTLYTYKIQAFNQDGSRTSTSCEDSIRSRTYAKPEFVYLKYATVEDNDHIKIEWLADEAPISKYSVLRSEDDGVTYDTISRISDLAKYDPPQFYIDTTADFNRQSYYYKIIALDSCGANQIASVNLARTILLTNDPLPAVSGRVNELKWNAYEDWPSEVDRYEIYRKLSGTSDLFAILDDVDGNTLTYSDSLSILSGSGGQFSYYIKAIEIGGDNGYESETDNSISNVITISRESRIFMPNAIIAGGESPDDEFKPVVQFFEPDGYQLIIFNKWGQQLFESREVSKGWMGKYNGEYVPEDAYVYVIRYKDNTGLLQEKRGTVTVIWK